MESTGQPSKNCSIPIILKPTIEISIILGSFVNKGIINCGKKIKKANGIKCTRCWKISKKKCERNHCPIK